jgi:hypothetical protein
MLGRMCILVVDARSIPRDETLRISGTFRASTFDNPVLGQVGCHYEGNMV